MKKYYNVKDVCEISGFKRITIIQHIRAGHLKFYKPKGSHEFRFTEQQIEDFMQSGSPEIKERIKEIKKELQSIEGIKNKKKVK